MINRVPELAFVLLRSLRAHSRRQLNNNIVIGVPLLDAYGWAERAPATGPEELREASKLLHVAKLCVSGFRHLPSGTVETIQLTELGRDLSEAEARAKIFPDAS